jgi:hypothetical protein
MRCRYTDFVTSGRELAAELRVSRTLNTTREYCLVVDIFLLKPPERVCR